MDVIIAIDTGVHTGLAVWDIQKKRFETIDTMPIHRALSFVKNLQNSGDYKIRLIFEDARKRRWIPDSGDARTEAGRRQGAGSVKRDAKIWEDFCVDYRINYEAIAPIKGATKYTADRFKAITGYQGRTTEHSRDAAMMVFGM